MATFAENLLTLENVDGFIAMKLFGFDFIPVSQQTKYLTFLSSKAGITVTPVIVEPDYLYASIDSIVKYNVNVTSLDILDIEAFVTSAIQTYNTNNLSNFNSNLIYSDLVESINLAQSSIVGNQTTYKLMKKLIPTVGSSLNYQILFGQALNSSLAPQNPVHSSSLDHCLISSNFYFNGVLCNLEDDGSGNLRIVVLQSDGNDHQILSGAGTVDYTSGIVNLFNFAPTSYIGDSIRFYAKLQDGILDSSTAQNVIYEIPNDEINVTAVAVRQ